MKRTILDFFNKESLDKNKKNQDEPVSKKSNVDVFSVQPGPGPSKIFPSSDSAHNISETTRKKPFDIGFAVGQRLSDYEKIAFLSKCWIPDSNYNFALQKEGKQMRKFSYQWLQQYSWLSYSEYKNGCFCRFCVIFAPDGAGVGSQELNTMIKEPLAKYKKAREVFSQHETTNYHRFSVIKADEFLKIQQSEKPVSVAMQLDKQKTKMIQANKKRLIPIVETVLFCAFNKLPLRGHRDDGEFKLEEDDDEEKGSFSESKGGLFRNLLKFRIKSGDNELKNHLASAGKNCTMISKTIQNEIISCIGDVIRSRIVNEIKESKFFTILCDETTDISSKEQMTLCLRYVNKTNEIQECFLGFVELQSTTGESIKNAIEKEIKELGLSFEHLRGQGYYGGSNMAGKFNGVQALIKKDQPLAIYTHCLSHCLNLVISKSCEVPEIRNMMGIIGSVCTFFSSSAKRVHVLKEAVAEMNLPENRKNKLKPLCATRWVERHESVLTFKELLDPISTALETLEHAKDSETSSKAMSFSATIRRSDFIIALEVTSCILAYTLNLSRSLQNLEQDLSTALSEINIVKNTLNRFRENQEQNFNVIYTESCEAATKIGCNITMPRVCKRQTQRSNIFASNEKDYFRKIIFLPFLDHVNTQLAERFDEVCKVLPLEGIIPFNLDKYTDDEIITTATNYEQDLSGSVLELKAELGIWREKWIDSKTKPKTCTDALNNCSTMCFPNIQTLLRIFATLPVTTATGERSFSALKLLKSYLRSTIGQERLNGLALAYIHKTRKVNIDEVINLFCQIRPRRSLMSDWTA